jgi:hypothetical protein
MPHVEEQPEPQTNGYQNGVDHEYHIREEPLGSREHVSVVCIGAGVSGLAVAIRVQETMKDCDFDIYEKNGDIGGTWLENRYPGCACMLLSSSLTSVKQ